MAGSKPRRERRKESKKKERERENKRRANRFKGGSPSRNPYGYFR